MDNNIKEGDKVTMSQYGKKALKKAQGIPNRVVEHILNGDGARVTKIENGYATIAPLKKDWGKNFWERGFYLVPLECLAPMKKKD